MWIGILATALIATQGALSLPKQDAPAHRNIVLLVADDQGYADLGCSGLAPDVQTPHLDRLAAQGTRFTQAYATSPICNASRAALMTGCYQQRFGTYWYGGKGIHDPQYSTMAEWLSKSGYRTGYVGKFHYGAHKVHVPGNRNFPTAHGFDVFFGSSGGRKHYLHHRASLEESFLLAKRQAKRKGQSLRQGPMWNGEQQEDVDGFGTEIFGQKAVDFLREHRAHPFFLTVAFNAVHNFTHQLPPAYLKEHGIEGYHDWDPAKEEYYDWYRRGRFPNNPEGREHYLGQLHFLDREVGRILDALQTLGLEEETLVIYIGDNGGSTPIYANNTPLRGSKYTLYEGGIRVPFILRGPGIVEGAIEHAVVSAMDVFPTVCEVAGLSKPEHLDGHSLVSNKDSHQDLHWETGKESAMRRGPWKYRSARQDSHAQYEMVELELGEFLYNLEEDPSEKHDLKGAHPDLMSTLRKAHETWKQKVKSS